MRIGVVYNKQLGDLVLLQPALAHLAKESGEDVALFTRPQFKPLERLFPRTRFLGESERPSLQQVECLDEGTRSLKRAFWLKGRKRLLLPDTTLKRWWRGLLFREVRVLQPGGRYRAFYYLEAVDAGSRTLPELLPPPDHWQPPQAPSQPYLLLHLSSGWRRKSWPAVHWIGVIRRLLELSEHHLVLSAGGSKEHERELSAEVQDAFAAETRVVPLAGASFEAYLSLVRHARMLITVDGSAAHLAAAWGVPAITLFGPTDPTDWHFARPGQIALHGPGPIVHERTAADIPPDQVLAAARSLLLP